MRLPPQVELDLQAAENRIDELNKGQKAGPTRLRGLRSSIEAALRSQSAPAERTALETVAALIRERDELNKHQHGFAYPECPKCDRLKAIVDLIGAGPQARQEQE